MKKYPLFLGVIAASLLLAACSEEAPTKNQANQAAVPQQSASQAATPAANPDWPTYRVGSEVNYEPFEFMDEKGNAVGFEIELLQAIGQKAKFNVHVVNESRKDLQTTLDDGRYAIWASALSVSPERAEKMDLSEPYLDFVRVIYVLDKPENNGLKSPADFKDKKLAVSEGSSSAIQMATELTGSEDKVVKAKSFYQSLTEVYKGNVDGTFGDSRILQYYQKKHGDSAGKTRIIDMGDKPKGLAFAVKKGNSEVLKQINEGLAAVKADGTYDKLLEKWFGVEKK